MAKKLHVEITASNWHRLKQYVQDYNADPGRVTPRCKPADVINLALHRYLEGKKVPHGAPRKAELHGAPRKAELHGAPRKA